jgi:hypothetical protein
MQITVENFDDFVSGSYDYNPITKEDEGLWLRQEKMDIGGGRISISDINKIKNYPGIDTVCISGLTQDTFEYFIQNYGHQLRAIRFFKNKLVADWSLLGELKNLEFVYFFHNQRIEALWDMSANVSLKGLAINDFSRLKTIAGVERAPNLEVFHIGDAIWSTTVIDTFRNLAGTKIKQLSFSGKKIEDDDLSYLSEMKCLETFDFPLNLYTTEQVAWVVANFPQIKGYALRAVHESQGYDGTNHVMVIGKRKPSFELAGNENRVRKYVDNFQALIEKYKGKTYSQAFRMNE